MDAGVLVTVNSDDPAYFGGYITDNYRTLAQALSLTPQNLYQLAKNSFLASFVDENRRSQLLSQLDHIYTQSKLGPATTA